MFSHIFVGTNDFERALAFYRPLLDALGIRARFWNAGHLLGSASIEIESAFSPPGRKSFCMSTTKSTS